MKNRLYVCLFVIFFPLWLLTGFSAMAWSAEPAAIDIMQLESGQKLDPLLYFYEDKHQALNFNKLDTLPEGSWLQHHGSSLNFGYTNSTYWFRINLHNPSHEKVNRLVELAYPVLDYIDVHIHEPGKPWQLLKLGDKYPFNQRIIDHRSFLLPISVAANSSLELVFRVKTSSSMQFPAKIWQERDFFVENQHQGLVMGLYYGIMVVMVLYNLFIFIAVRERNYLYYVFYVACMALFISSLQGLSFQYLWPQSTVWNDNSIVFFLSGAIIFGLFFTFNLLQLRQFPSVDMAGNLITGILVLIVFSSGVVSYHNTIRMLIIMAVFCLLLALAAGIIRWAQGQTSARYYVIAWSTMLLGGIILALSKFDIIPRNILTENIVQIGSGLEVILLSFALADRMNREKRKRLDAQALALENERLAHKSQFEAFVQERKAREAQAAALEIQKQATETLEVRVKERTEELEAVNKKLELMSITDPLTNLRNRRYFDQTLEHEMARAIRQQQAISVLMIDIDHFKSINDTYGHQIGDKVLKQIAQSLGQTISRSTDLLARFGGEEFVVVLPDTSAGGAVHLAECIRRVIEKLDFSDLHKDLKVTISLGVYGDEPKVNSHFENWVRYADEALYKAKELGRNRAVNYHDIKRLSTEDIDGAQKKT